MKHKSLIRWYSFKVLTILLFVFFNCDISETPINENTTGLLDYDLSSIKRIALLTFVGRSTSCPNDSIHHRLTDKVWEKFEPLMTSNPSIEFISMNQIVKDEAYKMVTSTVLPQGAYSPINGLSYIKYGVEGGFDCAPLLESLGADAALTVVIFWGNSVRNNGTNPFINAHVESGLIVPPERPIWKLSGNSQFYEEQIPITVANDPLLMLAIGLKWVVLMQPTENEYLKLNKYALKKETKIADKTATGLYYSILRGLERNL